MNKTVKIIVSIAVIAGFFALWEIAARLGWIDTQFVPAFSAVLEYCVKLLKSGELFVHIGTSLLRLFAGIGLAVITALPLGFLLAGWKPRLTAFLTPLLVNLSLVNAFTLLPIFIILFGLGEVSKVLIIYYVVVFPALFGTINGILNIDPQVMKIARIMGAGGVKIFFSVILPGCIARLFAGIKSSVTMGFTVLLGAEMVGAKAGLGYLIFISNKRYDIPAMFVGILLIAVTGTVVTLALDKLQKSLTVREETVVI